MKRLFGAELAASIEREMQRIREVQQERDERISRGETDYDDCFVSIRSDAQALDRCRMELDILKGDGCVDFDAIIDENGEEVCYHPKKFNLPEPTTKPVDENFVTWYINTIKNSPEKVTIVPVGPLTDIAILLRAEPSIVDNIEEIVIMGGGHEQRNSTAAAEFNIWKDPEAAEIVMNCGAKITLVPLDATHAASTRLSEVQQYKDLHTPVGDMIAELIEIRTRAYNILQPLHEPDLCPIHDALCVAYLINPEVLKNVLFTRVDVDISGGFADGMTIVDTRHFHNLPDNCHVALSADRDLFNKILFERVASFK